MEGSSDTKDSSQCVRVAVNVRPLVTPELLVGCTDCVTIVHSEPQVQIGSHSFTFDYVFGSSGSPSSQLFDDCVAPIVDALFHGYNGTVLAYGQTGSGKTYTMGTNFNGDDQSGGVIPKVMETIFSRVESSRESIEYLIRVSFIEIFKEEVFDLLDPNPPAFSRSDLTSQAKPSGPARVPIQIRETINGGITLAGVTEAEVRTKEEMATFLLRGSVARATGSTNMNSQSSRSHAIFTIALEQKKIASCPGRKIHNDDGDDILIAKLHLVDLAGSERAKRTGADGMRFREGIHINKGLLALGNVISALGDEKRRKEGGHVPYRDSKLTRLLQDSLGGNSKTVMIACVSPADTNAEETLNTLKYANRARNIQNKAIINRDPVAAQMQKMRGQIEELQTELSLFRGDSGASVEELQILKHKMSLLEASNKELQRELQDRKIECEHLTQRALDAQIEKDKLLMKIESARNGKSWDEIDSDSDQELGLLKSYVSKIQELEGELLRVQNRYILKETKQGKISNHITLEDEVLSLGSDGKDDEVEVEAEVEVKELEHSSLQQQLDRELKELDQKLEQKEAEMKRFATTDTSVLKQHFTKKIHELEQEKRNFQKEIEELKNKLANISSNSDESAQKLKEDYLQRMNTLETQVVQLKKKQDAQAQLQRQKEKSDEAAKRLQDEIHRIKTQKVQLQQKIKQESEQFRLWKASREKEVLQLKKEGRRKEYEMHKLAALNQRQKMVLQRKTEEAAMATKRLKDVLDTRKASSRDLSGAGNATATIQALMQAIEHELEVASRVHEVRSEYERQMKERAKMAKELAQLKEEAQNLKQMNLSGSPHTMSPGARSSRQFALENMLSTSSSAIISMASHLSEAEERERAFTGRGRWNQIRSVVEAKNLLNYVFNLASTSRCQSWDSKVLCREKDMEIRELKEKVVHLVKQVEMQKNALSRQENLHMLSSKKHANDHLVDSGTSALNHGKGNMYQLRQTGFRSSMAFGNAGNNIHILEDMDISDSDDDWVLEDQDLCDDSEWEASGRPLKAKRRNLKTDKKLTILRQPSLSSENESVKEEASGEEIVPENQKGMCCTCSRSSSCKTMRCECRAKGGLCDKMCGCVPSKCSNRDASAHSDEREISQGLASQGALLLQRALSEKPVETNGENEHMRKALSDIGNTLVKSKAPNPSQRKKWKKSTFQLVPAGPTPQPETTEPERKPVGPTTETEMHLQLPRAMRATAMNTNPLKERNSEHQNEVAVNKEERTPTPTSPREYGIRDEKENGGV